MGIRQVLGAVGRPDHGVDAEGHLAPLEQRLVRRHFTLADAGIVHAHEAVAIALLHGCQQLSLDYLRAAGWNFRFDQRIGIVKKNPRWFARRVAKNLSAGRIFGPAQRGHAGDFHGFAVDPDGVTVHARKQDRVVTRHLIQDGMSGKLLPGKIALIPGLAKNPLARPPLLSGRRHERPNLIEVSPAQVQTFE